MMNTTPPLHSSWIYHLLEGRVAFASCSSQVRQVLECGSPLPLSVVASPSQSGRGQPHSKTLSRTLWHLALLCFSSLESPTLTGIFNHGLTGSHGWRGNPCWLGCIRVIREIRGASRILPILPLALGIFCSLACPAADYETVLAGWFAAQSNLHTWSAELVQTRSLKVLSQPLVSPGRVWVAVPDQFRWELGQPAQTIALRDRDLLSIIYPRLKRVEKYPLNDKQPGPWRDALALLEASFPRDRATLEAHFRMLSAQATNGVFELVLQPRSASARRFMTEIQVSLRTNDFSLAATELRFSDGSALRNDFTNAALNPPLPAGIFDTKPEPGFTVVEPLRQ
jgi:outer membrane lipoprotein-sorting protein